MKSLVCLGDSITDAGRIDSPDGLGYGYVKYLSEKLNQKEFWKISNRGVDGFTLSRLLDNIERDCCQRNPDVVTILIGINDIGLLMNTNRTSVQQEELLLRFHRNYDLLLSVIRSKTHARLILMEPFVFPWPLEYAHWIPYTEKLSVSIQQLAESYDAEFLPLSNNLIEMAEKKGYSAVTTDGIHLTDFAHTYLAERLYTLLSVSL